ncbi:hypothetical protein [Corynebacterium comes]|uniref:Uncharacterized protein n=1 Tax=Corynebacterium comes TaxID=2675218 RepID=A0A6B8W218_9CORY|nr:hypothetical protein [Corynebacterium comes]QGU05465.1 hypothetical protein CETAM_11160 [Corynebacterium comes]
MSNIPDLERNPDLPVSDFSRAPLPTEGTLRARRSIPYQFTRFVVNNTRMARLAFSKH